MPAPRPQVILTTAYEQYVLDYLLKPISFERFVRAASKAYEFFHLREEPSSNPDYLFVKADGRLEKVLFADILFVEGLENYVAIYTTTRKLITHYYTQRLISPVTGQLAIANPQVLRRSIGPRNSYRQ